METSPLICSSSKCTGFYKIGIFVMEELNEYKVFSSLTHFVAVFSVISVFFII